MTERKEQILSTAMEILESKSFSAFSYQDLADRLGIRKASIHHHFPTKDSLGLALLERYQENGNRIMGELASSGSPAQALAGMFDLSEEVLLKSPSEVCPSGAFEVDAEALSEAMLAKLRQTKTEFLENLAELLNAARQQGDISFLGDCRDQAAAIMAAMQGAREAVPILGVDFFRGVIRQLKRSLGL